MSAAQQWFCGDSLCPPTDIAPQEISEDAIGEEHIWSASSWDDDDDYWDPDWQPDVTGPYARCGGECGRIFPLADFDRIPDEE